MNRKVTVFIILILLASSFKYRTKSAEAKLTPSTDKGIVPKKPAPSTAVDGNKDFEEVVASLQKANQEFASGDPAPFKALWSRQSDVSVLDKSDAIKTVGWKAVEAKLNSESKTMRIGNEYSFENINTQLGSDLACVLQKEHYIRPNGRAIDLRVTVLFRKEADGWKIVHRHAENLK